jgi:hypothetical protein
VLAHGIETAVLIPLVIALGAIWDATGAAAAVLVSTVVFCAVWGVLLVRIRRAGGPSAVAPQPHQAVTR